MGNKEAQKEYTGYPSIDKPWLKYYSEEAINAVFPECTIYGNIYDHNRAHLTDVALLYFGKKISYEKLFSEVDKAARALACFHIKNNDNVAICMPATPEAIYIILALNRLGANAVMLNPTFSEEQLTERINETEASLMVVVNELYSAVRNVIPQTGIKYVITCPAVNSLGVFVKLYRRVKNIPDTISWNAFVRQGKAASYTPPLL